VQVNDLKLGLVLHVLILQCSVLPFIHGAIEASYLLPCLANILFQCGIIALNCLKLLLQSKNLVLLELSLCVLLLKLAFYIALLILEVLHLVALGLHLTFSLKSSLHPRLNFKRVLFEQSQLLHELVFLLNELLIAH